MRKFLITITIFTLVILFSCSCDSNIEKTKAGPASATLTWKNFDGDKENDPMEASYVYNGVDVGKGSEGFFKVIDEIKKLSPDSEIQIYPFWDYFFYKRGDSELPVLHIDHAPFLRMPYQFQLLRMIARKHKIDIWFYAAKPGEEIKGVVEGWGVAEVRDGKDVREKVDLQGIFFAIGNSVAGNSLTWKDYDGYKKNDPEKAVYFFNSVNCGKGSKGFARAIKEYKSDLRDLELIIYPDSYDQDVLDAMEQEDGLIATLVDPVPFRKFPDQYQLLQEAVREHVIEVRYFASENWRFSAK